MSRVGNNGTTESSPAVSLRLSEEADSVSVDNENGKEPSEDMEQQVKVQDEELGVVDDERRENGNGSHQQNGDCNVDGNGDNNVNSDGNGESNGNGDEKSPEQSDSESASSSSSSSSSSEEEMVFTKTLRRRPVDLKEEQAKQERALLARITKILKKEKKDWTDAEGDVVDENPKGWTILI